MQSAAISTQERKAQLLTKSLRIADKAADRIEDQIDGANITQATIAFGVATEKSLLFAGEPSQIVQVNLAAEDIYSELRKIQAEIIHSLKLDSTDTEFTKLLDTPAVVPCQPGIDSAASD